MPIVQPPNTQTLRPQHLTQVGHEGNPVECFIDVTGTLDSPNPFCTADDEDCPGGGKNEGGPVIFPAAGGGSAGSGGGGEESESPVQPLSGGHDVDFNCYLGITTVTVTANGGTAPFTFSSSAGVVTQTGPRTATITPAPNTGSAVNGIAYEWASKYCTDLGFSACIASSWKCDGSIDNDCVLFGGAACSCPDGDCTSSQCWRFGAGTFTQPCADAGLSIFGSACAGLYANHNVCDARDASMISDGCNPCEVQFINGANVTIMDGDGHSAVVMIDSN